MEFDFTACHSKIYSHFSCFPDGKLNFITHFLLFTAQSHLVEQSPSQIARILNSLSSVSTSEALTIIHFLDEGTVVRNGYMARAEAKWTQPICPLCFGEKMAALLVTPASPCVRLWVFSTGECCAFLSTHSYGPELKKRNTSRRVLDFSLSTL